MDYTPVLNLVKICHQHGVQDVVISPGSRSAPLTIAFNRFPYIKKHLVSDERSAAFIALGMAQKSKRTVVLVCTSGTAGLNYSPAIAEAFYNTVPLLVLTADRPPELIDQQDGQTIHQKGMFGDHVKMSFQTPVNPSSKDEVHHHGKIVAEALMQTVDGQPGPVHINIPFREPFYPTEDLSFESLPNINTDRTHREYSMPEAEWANIIADWGKYSKKLIIGGQGSMKSGLTELMEYFNNQKQTPVLGDVLSNLHYVNGLISLQDLFLGQLDEEQQKALQPDLLVTFGRSVISKNLKLFLRKYKPKAHWHIQRNGHVADTYQSLSKVIRLRPSEFFTSIKEIASKGDPEYLNKWQSLQKQSKAFIGDFHGKQEFNEFSTVHTILDNLPMGCDIHLANSMPVRWANYYGFDHSHVQLEIFSNRGTSGIDGCTSTAIGSAVRSDRTTLLLTGDMAFLYDRNAFWNDLVPDNFRVIVLNNHGGGIFDLINGPREQQEHPEFFLTHQPLKAKALAEEFGLKYYHCESLGGLSNGLDKFWIRDGHAKILEIETNIAQNTKTFELFKAEANTMLNEHVS